MDVSYKKLLLHSITVSIHQSHLWILVTEILKTSQITPQFMRSFFKQKKLSYDLRKGHILNLPKTQSTYYEQSSC